MEIEAKEYEARRAAILAACADLKLDAVVALANGSCFGLSGVSQGYMGFLSGWDSFDSPSALVLRPGQRPFLLVSHFRMKMMALENIAGIEVDWIDQNEFGAGLRRVLGDGQMRLGICGWEDVIAKTWKNIEASLSGCQMVEIKDRFVALRAVKSPAQLEMHRTTAAICDKMFALLPTLDVVGRTTFAIKADLERLAKQHGCEFVQHWMTAGESPDYPRYFEPENRQVPKAGDTVLYGMMMTRKGVWAHAVRSFRVGAPDARQDKIQDEVLAFQRRFLARLKPGEDLSQVVRDGLADTGPVMEAIGDSRATMLRLGHAMGHSYTEPGMSEAFPRSFYKAESEAGRAQPFILREGMVFQVHPIFLYPGGAAGVGDIVVVGKEGAGPLTKSPRNVVRLAS